MLSHKTFHIALGDLEILAARVTLVQSSAKLPSSFQRREGSSILQGMELYKHTWFFSGS